MVGAMKTQKHVASEMEKRLEITHHLPSLRRLSIGVVIVTLAVCFAWPISSATQRATLTSGPLSNHHRLIEAQCERCHQAAFRGTPDKQCQECHTVNQHAAAMPSIIKARPELEARCASCHKEHHGERSLVPDDSPLCTGCHKRVDQLLPGTEQPNFGDFDHHPEFAVHGWIGNPPVYRRLRLGDKSIRSDTPIKFSHKTHMRLKNEDKPMLTCDGCHATADDSRSFRPVSFVHQCARCHPIRFDERLREVSAPHGNADNVLPFVTAAIARLHFDDGERGEEARKKIDKESHDDEVGLFTENGGCNQCHDVEEVAAAEAVDGKHHYLIAQPNIPERWMPASRFSHPTHRFVACESCHAGRSESTSAADINLPSITRCRECHADPPTPGKVASPCLQCHDYHSHEQTDKRYGNNKLQTN